MSTRLFLLALFSGLLAGCASKRLNSNDYREPPPWAIDPLSVKMKLARDLVEQKNYPLALDVIRDLRADGEVKDPELDLLQGISLREQGLRSEAQRLLERARDRMPRDAEVHEALCVLYADIEQLDVALQSCERATRLNENSASAWNNLGFILLTLDRPEEAISALERAVDRDSAEPRYRNNLALAQASVGRHRDALRTFMSTGPRVTAHYNVALALERKGEPDQALSYYDEALKLDPTFEPARDAVARLRPAQEN